MGGPGSACAGCGAAWDVVVVDGVGRCRYCGVRSEAVPVPVLGAAASADGDSGERFVAREAEIERLTRGYTPLVGALSRTMGNRMIAGIMVIAIGFILSAAKRIESATTVVVAIGVVLVIGALASWRVASGQRGRERFDAELAATAARIGVSEAALRSLVVERARYRSTMTGRWIGW